MPPVISTVPRHRTPAPRRAATGRGAGVGAHGGTPGSGDQLRRSSCDRAAARTRHPREAQRRDPPRVPQLRLVAGKRPRAVRPTRRLTVDIQQHAATGALRLRRAHQAPHRRERQGRHVLRGTGGDGPPRHQHQPRVRQPLVGRATSAEPERTREHRARRRGHPAGVLGRGHRQSTRHEHNLRSLRAPCDRASNAAGPRTPEPRSPPRCASSSVERRRRPARPAAPGPLVGATGTGTHSRHEQRLVALRARSAPSCRRGSGRVTSEPTVTTGTAPVGSPTTSDTAARPGGGEPHPQRARVRRVQLHAAPRERQPGSPRAGPAAATCGHSTRGPQRVQRRVKQGRVHAESSVSAWSPSGSETSASTSSPHRHTARRPWNAGPYSRSPRGGPVVQRLHVHRERISRRPHPSERRASAEPPAQRLRPDRHRGGPRRGRPSTRRGAGRACPPLPLPRACTSEPLRARVDAERRRPDSSGSPTSSCNCTPPVRGAAPAAPEQRAPPPPRNRPARPACRASSRNAVPGSSTTPPPRGRRATGGSRRERRPVSSHPSPVGRPQRRAQQRVLRGVEAHRGDVPRSRCSCVEPVALALEGVAGKPHPPRAGPSKDRPQSTSTPRTHICASASISARTSGRPRRNTGTASGRARLRAPSTTPPSGNGTPHHRTEHAVGAELQEARHALPVQPTHTRRRSAPARARGAPSTRGSHSCSSAPPAHR